MVAVESTSSKPKLTNGHSKSKSSRKAKSSRSNKKESVKERSTLIEEEGAKAKESKEKIVKKESKQTSKKKRNATEDNHIENKDKGSEQPPKAKRNKVISEPSTSSNKHTGSKEDSEEVDVNDTEKPKSNRAKEVKKPSSNKRALPVEESVEAESNQKPKAKRSKATTPKPAAAPKMNKTSTDYASINFNLTEDKSFNLKISSWNVAGLKAWLTKDGLKFIDYEKPDIICLQETKCLEDQLPSESKIKGYHPYWLCTTGGHAGVALHTKVMPHNVQYGIGDPEQDQNGRILTAEYEKYYVVCVYVPNAGRGLVNLDKRMRWDKLFHDYLKKLDAKKPVILAGDMNVAHEEIDLTNPKSNKRNAGFTQEERDGMTKMISLGFVDTFRSLYPKQAQAYTFWTYMGNARSKNVGWRLDYFFVSERLTTKVVDNVMRSQIFGSDHCPITLFLNL